MATPCPDDDDEQRALALNEKAKALWRTFCEDGTSQPLDEAIAALEEGILISQSDTIARAKCLINIGVFLSDRARLRGSAQDLRASIDFLRQASQVAPPQFMSTALLNLGNSLQEQFNFDRNQQHALDEAIEVYEEALAGSPTDSDRPKLQNGISAASLSRFSILDDTADLERASCFGQLAIDSDASHPYRSTFLDTLSCALSSLFRLQGDERKLDQAIEYGEEAVGLAESQGSPNLPLFYTNFAESLLTRSSLCGHGSDLDVAIELLETALPLFPEDQIHAGYCTLHYARALQHRFERDGGESDITLCVDLLGDLLLRTPPDRRLFAEFQRTLVISFILRTHVTGSMNDLDQAVNMLKSEAGRIAGQQAAAMSVYQNLGVALLTRFEMRGSYSDLADARLAYQTALDQEVEGSLDYTLPLIGLANVALRSFQETDAGEELDDAIRLYERALSQSVAWENLRCARLASLGYALQLRYGRNEVPADFDRCIEVCREALTLSEGLANQPNMFHCLGQLGNAYLQKYQTDISDKQDVTGLRTAILYLEAAVEKAARHPPAQAMFLNNLGLAHQVLYAQSHDRDDRDLGIAAFRTAMNLDAGSPLLRMTAAYRGLVLVGKVDMVTAADFVDRVVEIMPRLSPRTLRRADQQHMISLFSSIGSYGAAVMLENGRPPVDAVKALEATRGVMNRMLMETRTDVDALRQAGFPDLAERFNMLRDQLGSAAALPLASDPRQTLNWESEAHVVAARDFDAVVGEIQALPGFENFMQPLAENEMVSLADQASIVMINVSILRSDALIIDSTGVRNHVLPRLRLPDLVEKANALTDALHCDNSSERRNTIECIRDIQHWLWEAVVQDVHAHLSHGKQGPIRVCWIPVGPMALLPIHAAADPKSDANALDLIVSSYGTTLKELSYAHGKQPPNLNSAAALVSYMAQTPNQPDLKYAADEAKAVGAILQRLVTTTVLPAPAKNDILTHIKNSSIVHFSCHGFADAQDPSASRILLRDWETDPLTVADIAALHLRGAQFAYLSACHAAVGRAADLLDEGIHLAGAFQIAGFPRVVGTLWQVDDERAMQVAGRVYQSLVSEAGQISFDKLADALNAAVRKLRMDTRTIDVGGMTMEVDEDDPFVWAPMIYMGL
ncbi:hypothetical protein LTR48_001413 [Friedmanniomyces endolithicus]|uniref:CHAT domain-containing protein n=1 Tax=Rachicladosporium monterosium TaxID=1507873 RepID=A0ABR0L162_9PEZI|nr:hypothetical protein LTR29_017754 [Friedmanniomyces endolithicus]KAK1088577.1 hypothetical protein LTR48_001413 [Friedmanniomyces endolithicus]KAK5141906.1 hypothetical protein LTR32_005640 [Rachicladosporium monterosium]